MRSATDCSTIAIDGEIEPVTTRIVFEWLINTLLDILQKAKTELRRPSRSNNRSRPHMVLAEHVKPAATCSTTISGGGRNNRTPVTIARR